MNARWIFLVLLVSGCAAEVGGSGALLGPDGGSSGGSGGDGGAMRDGQAVPDGAAEGDGGAVPAGVAFAIMGDSNSDEYRADDNRGGAYSSVTFNWMEQLVLHRGLNFGTWGTWGGSRRSGFEYNWARSGARSDDLLGQGQAAGVAQQVADGLVHYVYVDIGANDFHAVNGTYREIYDGSMSDGAVATKVANMIGDIEQAVDIVLVAEPIAVLLMTIGDAAAAPDTALAFPDAAGRDRVSAAIADVNEALTNFAATRPLIAIVDNNSLLVTAILGNLDENGMLMVGGEFIDLIQRGNEPHHGRLGDSSGHAGTVIGGVVANALFIDPLNQISDFSIARFTDEEILSHAGL